MYDIVKTFYSRKGKSRAHINKRKDGLYEVIGESLEQDSYVSDEGDKGNRRHGGRRQYIYCKDISKSRLMIDKGQG